MYFVISWNENKETKRVGRIKVQPIVRNCPKKERPCRTARYGPPFSIAQIKSLNQGAKKSNFQEWIPWRRGTSGRGAQTGQLWGGHNYQQLLQSQLSTMTTMTMAITIVNLIISFASNYHKKNYHNCQLRFPLTHPNWNCHKYLHCHQHYHNHCHCHKNVTQVIEQIYKYIPEARQGKAHLDHVSICHQHHLLHQHLPHDHKHHDHLDQYLYHSSYIW